MLICFAHESAIWVGLIWMVYLCFIWHQLKQLNWGRKDPHLRWLVHMPGEWELAVSRSLSPLYVGLCDSERTRWKCIAQCDFYSTLLVKAATKAHPRGEERWISPHSGRVAWF